jgi:hypothetical protein
MKILFCGDRNWSNRIYIQDVIKDLLEAYGIFTVIHGAARGADTIAGEEAIRLGLEVIEVPANWDLYQKRAGMIRNAEMLKLKPKIVIAFHADFENSKGTKHMVAIAKKAGVHTLVLP